MQSIVAEASAIGASSSASATVRLAVLSALAGSAFLGSYMVFHALHVAGRDPSFVRALTTIPLFATCEAALLAGSCLGLALALALRDFERSLRQLPRILFVVVALFTLEILLFP
jgi:hypothetical protein